MYKLSSLVARSSLVAQDVGRTAADTMDMMALSFIVTVKYMYKLLALELEIWHGRISIGDERYQACLY